MESLVVSESPWNLFHGIRAIVTEPQTANVQFICNSSYYYRAIAFELFGAC